MGGCGPFAQTCAMLSRLVQLTSKWMTSRTPQRRSFSSLEKFSYGEAVVHYAYHVGTFCSNEGETLFDKVLFVKSENRSESRGTTWLQRPKMKIRPRSA